METARIAIIVNRAPTSKATFRRYEAFASLPHYLTASLPHRSIIPSSCSARRRIAHRSRRRSRVRRFIAEFAEPLNETMRQCGKTHFVVHSVLGQSLEHRPQFRELAAGCVKALPLPACSKRSSKFGAVAVGEEPGLLMASRSDPSRLVARNSAMHLAARPPFASILRLGSASFPTVVGAPCAARGSSHPLL